MAYSQKIKISDIIINPNRREVGDITQLAQSIDELGLLNPVTLTQDFVLVAGRHRLEAVKTLGWQAVDCHIIELDDLHRELAEIDENLIRNELHYTEQDAQLARRKEIYEILYPETKHGGDRKSEESKRNNFDLISFTEDTSEKTGQSRRNVEMAVQRGTTFDNEDREVLKQADVPKTEALKLAREDEPTRKKVLSKIANGEAKTVKEAKREVVREERIKEAAKQPKPAVTVTLHEGDMLDIVPTLGKFDLIIADPPYNVTDWDFDKIGAGFLNHVEQWLTVCQNALADNYHLFWFCSPQYAADTELIMRELGLPIQSRIVWHRRNMSMGSKAKNKFVNTWEMCFHVGNYELNFGDDWSDDWFDVQVHAVPQSNFNDMKVHPTQKPLELIHRLVEFGSVEGQRVLDPFGGGGTTGAAAKDRDCHLVELDKEYTYVIRQRLGL